MKEKGEKVARKRSQRNDFRGWPGLRPNQVFFTFQKYQNQYLTFLTFIIILSNYFATFLTKPIKS